MPSSSIKGLKSIEVDSVRNLIGTGARALIQDSFKKQGCEVKDIENLTSSFLLKYKDCFKNKTCLYPKTKQTLKELKNNDYEIILVSNKPEYYCHELLKFFNIYGYFSKVSGGDTYDFRKPDPRHITTIIEILDGDRNKSIMIGDSESDANAAKAAGIPMILLEDGYTEKNTNEIYHNHLVKDFVGIENIISQYL